MYCRCNVGLGAWKQQAGRWLAGRMPVTGGLGGIGLCGAAGGGWRGNVQPPLLHASRPVVPV